MMTHDNPLTDLAWRWMIVDPCTYGRAGLKAALPVDWPMPENVAQAVATVSAARRALSCNSPLSAWRLGSSRGCLIVRLPAEPRTALAMLLELGTPAVQAAFTDWVTVLLTSVPVRRVRWLLAVTGSNPMVSVMDDRHPVVRLQRSVRAVCRASIRVRGENAEGAAWSAGAVLSERECRVLLLTLQGVAIAEVARRYAISHKTLYNQRHTALLKLGVRGMRGLLCLFADTAFTTGV
ncbi:helix-turn-helix transcriptional regulator [Serratia marcescens]|uniref:helix-turn-helix transcriptional regulator n=1 Tax=Serratia marcescens TaxID=615 RepID=UPI004045DF98